MIELNSQEARVVGCLMEKSVTVPDQYPLSLNALTNACNQKSSRDPVMNLEPGTVQHTARQLEDRGLLGRQEGKSGVEKYSQRFCNTLLSKCQFSEEEYAVITLLLLRGPQTPGELRSRSGRLYDFADNQAVQMTLDGLIDAEREGGAVIARLPRRQGRQDHEYMHLFFGEIESVARETIGESTTGSPRQDRVGQLEARVERLEAVLVSLAEKLGESVELDGETPD